MPIGWVDFSKDERTKVLSVLDLLVEEGTLDELGIAPIRDGFANMFFPGTSTIQTRAKYFCIVPYALKELELDGEDNRKSFLDRFDAIERDCAEILREEALSIKGTGDEEADIKASGVIGSRSLASGKWVKRTPADIYWAGLRRYNIFLGGNISLGEYARAVCYQNEEKANLQKYRNVNMSEDDNSDDENAGSNNWGKFWSIDTFDRDWVENLTMQLTTSESKFLKEKIILSCPDSMLAYVLKNNIREFVETEHWEDLEDIIHKFPVEMQENYHLANSFSKFNEVLGAAYNAMISNGEYAYANEFLEENKRHFEEIASLDLKKIYSTLHVWNKEAMVDFVDAAQGFMKVKDIDSLKGIIKKREKDLKGENRARTYHTGEFDKEKWFGLGALDYRFYTAKRLVRDIFEGEGGKHA